MLSSQNDFEPLERATYRVAKTLPIELQEQCAISFEGGLYTQALLLLSNMLISGSSWSEANGRLPTFVPPAGFIAFISTLTVHPSTTTKAKSSEKLEASTHANRYLRQLSLVAGPRNARLADAFCFHTKAAFRGRGSLSYKRRDTSVEDVDQDIRVIDAKIAGDQGLWARAEDFWHVVGWAFNCAAQKSARWPTWKLWLENMLDLMEVDLRECAHAEALVAGKGLNETVGGKSMIAQYVHGGTAGLGHGQRYRIMRAIFAHGTSTDRKEFKEIWKDETKEVLNDQRILDVHLKHRSNPEGLSLEDLSEDEDLAEEMELDLSIVKEEPGLSTRARRRTQTLSPKQEDEEDQDDFATDTTEILEVFGGSEAIYLRRRILTLISKLADIDNSLFANTDDVLDLFCSSIKPLPLPVFSLIMLPSGPYRFSISFHGSLCKEFFRSVLSITAPRFDTNLLDQEEMEQRYLSATANTTSTVMNAKVSLLLEAVLWLLQDHGGLQYTPELSDALRRGIQDRKAKSSQSRGGRIGKRQPRAEIEEGSVWLDASARRLQMLLLMFGTEQT